MKMFNKFYIIENGTVTGTVKRGGTFNGALLGKDMTDNSYQDLGLYGVIDEQPTITEFQRLGNQIQVIDEVNKTVTDTYEVIDFTTQEIFTLKLEQINREYEISIEALTAGVPNSEKQTWTKQELEARSYLVDNTTPTPFIDGIVTNRGVPKDYLVSKIIEKADAYTYTVAKLTGERQAKEDALI